MLARGRARRAAWRVMSLLCLGAIAGCGMATDEQEGEEISSSASALEAAVADQFAESAGPTPLIVSWTSSIGKTRQAKSLSFSVKNATSSGGAKTFTLGVEVFGLDNRRERREIGTYTLAPGASLSDTIAMSALPMKGVSHATSVEVIATVDHEGQSLRLGTPQAFAHFSQDYSRAWVYDYDTLVADHRSGHIAGNGLAVAGAVGANDVQVLQQAEHAARAASGGATTPVGGTTFGEPADEALESAALLFDPPSFNWFTVQAHWTTNYTDCSNGYYATTNPAYLPASYAKAMIQRMTCTSLGCYPVETVWEGVLSSVGSVEFAPLEQTLYRITVRSELQKGTALSTIRYKPASGSPYVQTSSSFFTTDSVGSGTHQADVNLANTVVGNVSAAWSQAFRMSDNGIGTNAFYITDAGPGGGSCLGANYSTPAACNQAGYSWSTVAGSIYTGGTDHLMKNLLAHEMGHQVQGTLTGTPGHTYGWNCVGNTCTPTQWGNFDPSIAPASMKCDHVTDPNARYHCLQSAETASAAGVEGWAHFYASKVWAHPTTETTMFNYYKQFRLDPPYGVLNPPVMVAADHNVMWSDTHWAAWTGAGGGTEYDWLQFIWRVHRMTANKSTMSEIREVYLDACNSSSCNGFNMTWPAFKSGALSYYGSASPKYQHILESAASRGVSDGT